MQPGDLLICTEYGEFYVGGCGGEKANKYTVDYVNPNADINYEKKKSGISKITAPTSFSAPNSMKAEGTFAWGNVKDEFPVESRSGQKHYFYYDTSIDEHTHLPRNVFWHCECGKEPSDGAEQHHASDCSFKDENKRYEIIWRKK